MEVVMTNTRNYYRTELFRIKLPVYKAAAAINIHPSRLSLILNEHVPMPDHVAERLDRVIAEHTEAAVG